MKKIIFHNNKTLKDYENKIASRDCAFPLLIDFERKSFGFFDVREYFFGYIDLQGGGLHVGTGFSVDGFELEAELDVAGVLLQKGAELGGDVVVDAARLGDDGEAVDELVLDGGQHLHVVQTELQLVGIPAPSLGVRLYVEEVADGHEVLEVGPVFAEEAELVVGVEVLDAHDAVGLVALGVSFLTGGDDAARADGGILEGREVAVERAETGVADVVENDAVLVQGVCGEVDADEVAFLVQAVQSAGGRHVD